MEIDKVCRLCADASEKPFHSIFSKNENGHQLIQLIKQSLPILVYRTDPLSKKICQKCYVKLNEYSSFLKNTIKTQDENKLMLLGRLHESPVKLYVDTLEDAFHPETIQITNYRSLRPFRSCASQIQVETQTISTNTIATNTNTTISNEVISFPKGLSIKNLTILTPSKINEKSDPSTAFVSITNEDGAALKKRKLNGPRAGPRCKTRPHLKPYNILTFQPLTLMQYALKQINRNFNLFDEPCNSLDSFATEETTETADTGSMYQDYDEYTPSPDVSTMESSEYSAAELQTDSIEAEPEPEPEFDFPCDIDINAPAICNYCMKKFPNLSDLAGHEINHIKVDIGPRVGTKEFNMLFTKLAFYFNDYMRRQNLLPPKEVKPISKPVTRNLSKSPATPKMSSNKAVFKAVASKALKTPIKLETTPLQFLKTPKIEAKQEEISKPVTRPKEKINYQDIDQPYDDDNSLLVPNTTNNQNHEYKIENDEIFVNGILLRNMEKNDRKACYKDIMVEGVKRKFCPLCRYTFKDNWSIENHYMSGICLYTCKFCGGKFKYHKELFESHLITHKGETANKVFGPRDRQFKKKLKNKRLNRPVKAPILRHVINSIPPKVKPIKIKQLMQKKMDAIKMPEIQPTKIKLEPGFMGAGNSEAASTSNSNEPYQAYFCRRCFKVFFNVTEYNTHIRVCCGAPNSSPAANTPKTKTTPLRSRDKLSDTRVSTPDSSSSSKRPLRACVKESPGLSSDNDSQGSDSMLKRSRKQITNDPDKVPENVWECGICCSSFPSKYSRNSHMRIHKGQANPNKVTPPPKTKLSMTSKQELQQTVAANFMQQQYHHQPLRFPPKPQQQQPKQELKKEPKKEPKQEPKQEPQEPQQSQQNIQYPNLNPAVARLVQNNPHLTIRSYSKSQQQQQQQQPQQDIKPVQQQQQNQHHMSDNSPGTASPNAEHSIKRNYKCADCDERFENKSVLYYHKMNSCIVKRHYECAFCRKKFGTYDQYNTHMFYVHPE